MSAAAFLAVTGVELTLPWPDEFTKQVAVTPPYFLPAGSAGNKTNSIYNSVPNASLLPSIYSRSPGSLLFHPHKKHESTLGCSVGGLDRSPDQPSDRMYSASSSAASGLTAATAGVPGPQLAAEYEAQLELYRRRQQAGLSNGGDGPSIPGDCRPLSPLSPLQDESGGRGTNPSPGSSSVEEMDVASSESSVGGGGGTGGGIGASASPPPSAAASAVSPVSSSPVPAAAAHFGVSALRAMSEAKRLEAEANAAVSSAQARVKKEKRVLDKARADVRVASIRLTTTRDRAAAALREVEAAANPESFDAAVIAGGVGSGANGRSGGNCGKNSGGGGGGSKPAPAAKKKRRRKICQDPGATSVAAASANCGPSVEGGGVCGNDTSKACCKGSSIGSGTVGRECGGRQSPVPATAAGGVGGGEPLVRSSSGGTAAAAGVGCGEGRGGADSVVEVDVLESGGIDAGMNDSVRAQLKTKPLKGWGEDVDAELGSWEVRSVYFVPLCRPLGVDLAPPCVCVY